MTWVGTGENVLPTISAALTNLQPNIRCPVIGHGGVVRGVFGEVLCGILLGQEAPIGLLR
jgi:hypothetical protein